MVILRRIGLIVKPFIAIYNAINVYLNAFLDSLAPGSIIPLKFDFGNQRKIKEIKEK
jgi:hypothetical protein